MSLGRQPQDREPDPNIPRYSPVAATPQPRLTLRSCGDGSDCKFWDTIDSQAVENKETTIRSPSRNTLRCMATSPMPSLATSL